MAKQIPMTLKNIFQSPFVKTLIDRSKEVDWSFLIDSLRPDMYNRKPSPALNVEGELQVTNLDFHTALSAIISRGAVINLPKYNAMRGSVLKAGEKIVSKENRHGKCIGVSSNKDVFSLGIKIDDAQVMKSDSVGEPRIYNFLDVEGNIHEGFKTIEFIPSEKEKDYINDWKIGSDNKIVFKHIISPGRRHAIYSGFYFTMKIAIKRINDEAKYLAGLITAMQKAGIKYPGQGEEGAPKQWPKSTKVGNEKKIKVKSITYEADIPPLTGAYPMIEMNQENLIAITEQRKNLIYKIKNLLQYTIRGNEYANYKYTSDTNEFPHWIKNVSWQEEFKKPSTFTVSANFIKKFQDHTNIILTLMKDRSYYENELPHFWEEFSQLNQLFFNNSEIPQEVKDKIKTTKGRVTFDRLVMFQQGVGTYGISLLRKTIDKTETVSKDYQSSKTDTTIIKMD